MTSIHHFHRNTFAGAFLACVAASTTAQSAEPTAAQPLTQEEAMAYIKGQRHTTVRTLGGNPRLEFQESGAMYGQNGDYSDSGKWQVVDGKLCMHWRRFEYEGCGQLVKVGSSVQHWYPNSTAVHLVFDEKLK